MIGKEQQITELSALATRSISHLTATVTLLSFDLLRSEDSKLHGSAKSMLNRLAALSEEMDEQWKLIAELDGTQSPYRADAVEEVQLHRVNY